MDDADSNEKVVVYLPAHMRGQAADRSEVLAEPGSLMDIIMSVVQQFPDLESDLLRGIQERDIAIAIDELITENDPTTQVKAGSEIRLLPAIAGG